ncbi:DUF7824 domain-containing protein [Sinosporangium siamense]|uniref:DUF7824 domain-containing protein n=1 Tax=Sinosporangium siamense TaxID=1367973 RepID=A0A919V759_9ACTN|nr:DUF6493 family protein [Sinosporangium siamense]GII92746.1 hypothetical protein Ssi02_29770 [Sinosporangium siamense]
MTGVWDEVRDLIDAGDVDPLVDRLVRLDDAERKAVAAELPGHIPVLRERAARMQLREWDMDEGEGNPEEWVSRWELPDGWPDLIRLAGAATISAVTGVVAWVNRREFSTWRFSARDAGFGHPEPVVRALAGRPAQWKADLAVRLAARVRGPRDAGAPLALAMLRHTGVEPPAVDPLVVAWVSGGPGSKSDPLFTSLMPRMFEAEGVGRELRQERLDPISPWLRTLSKRAAKSEDERETMLAGCVRRFLYGGTAQDLRFFVRLHDLLEPGAAEIAVRRRDYLRLLPAAPGTVAELALRHLRTLDDHDPADVVEALEALLFRAEAALARKGLTWLDQVARQAPKRVDDLVPALVTAFSHESYEVQGRAAQVARKHAKHMSPIAAEQVRQAVLSLPPALGAQVAEVFGGQVVDEEAVPAFEHPLLPEPVAPTPFPVVPTSSKELSALRESPWGWQVVERWLAAFVRLAGKERGELSTALSSYFSYPSLELFDRTEWAHAFEWQEAMARELATPGADTGIPLHRPGPDGEVVAEPRRDRLPGSGVTVLDLVLLRRCEEILTALKEDRLPPVLLATPTWSTWALDPETLLDRLAECQAAGATPLPADLQQALLRLPRGDHPEAAARAELLGSEAGHTAARWMTTGGLSDPTSGVGRFYREGGTEYDFDEREPTRVIDNLHLRPKLKATPTGLQLVDELLNEPPCWRRGDHGINTDWWTAVLPSHREIAAVYMLPYLSRWHWPRIDADHTAMLAAADGPAGPATAAILAHFLTQPDAEVAVHSFVTMAARGDLPAREIGNQLGAYIHVEWVKPQQIADSLTAAAQLGAHREVWQVLEVLLPSLLPATGARPRPGLDKIVEIAVVVAEWTAARGEIPGCAELLAGKSRSALNRGLSRLHEYLTRP